jgi:hypothetical protein
MQESRKSIQHWQLSFPLILLCDKGTGSSRLVSTVLAFVGAWKIKLTSGKRAALLPAQQRFYESMKNIFNGTKME